MSRTFQCLKPYLRSLQTCRISPSVGLSPAQLRYYAGSTSHSHDYESFTLKEADAQQRWNELRGNQRSLYPRAPSSDRVTSCQDFSTRYKKLNLNETAHDDDVTLCGMPENEKGKGWNNSCF